MIKILDDYVVVPGAYDYMLGKDTGRIDKETGTRIIKPMSYHGSLKQAILALRDSVVRKSLADVDGSLSDAICVLQQVNKRFEDVLTEAVEGGRK